MGVIQDDILEQRPAMPEVRRTRRMFVLHEIVRTDADTLQAAMPGISLAVPEHPRGSRPRARPAWATAHGRRRAPRGPRGLTVGEERLGYAAGVVQVAACGRHHPQRPPERDEVRAEVDGLCGAPGGAGDLLDGRGAAAGLAPLGGRRRSRIPGATSAGPW